MELYCHFLLESELAISRVKLKIIYIKLKCLLNSYSITDDKCKLLVYFAIKSNLQSNIVPVIAVYVK